ncbi:phosphonate metabolism protein/1,5-bisphosphokinase (PRPP-forming) PhnN [Pseudochrobactrum sp. HB0163]|uniref:phosphonate metabolism protein/1,5-bisphosphokinase (PRPP-forming) PhnN n=1 Tax=Pseudochrobactrum sp. HB0163 TaxID=3450708 RepID=UPI003F6E39BB
MNGIFVAVVGPSGAGKDTVIDYARKHLPQDGSYHFVRRVVTRKADGNAEDHDSMSQAEFLNAVQAGAFCLYWQAHGLYYGLPRSAEDALGQGAVVIANLSRRVLGQVAGRFAKSAIVHITANHDVLAQRLAARGRESPQSIAARLHRNETVETCGLPLQVIDNSGELHAAGEKFVHYLKQLRHSL